MKKIIIKKILTILIVLCFTLTCLTACDNEKHVHTYQDKWCCSQTQHWHECDCGKISELDLHIYENVIDDKYIKEQATTNTPAVYYKSCKCGFISNDIFLGEKLPNENINKSFVIDTNTYFGLNNINVKYESDYESCSNLLNSYLNGCAYNEIYTSINELTGILCNKENNTWKFSEWAKQELFTNNKWSYTKNLIAFKNTDYVMYTETNGLNEFYAYKGVTYNFAYNANINKQTTYRVSVFSEAGGIGVSDYDLVIYDMEYNRIDYSTVGLESIFETMQEFYFSITLKKSQNISIYISVSNIFSVNFTFGHSQDQSRTCDMDFDKIYALQVNINGGSIRFQIIQTAGQIVKFIDTKGNIYNVGNSDNNIILVMPSGEYVFYIKCLQASGSYNLGVYSGSHFIIE